jgi:CheY-like chemotaxis protein
MLRGSRILLVEDTPISAEIAGGILRHGGYAYDRVADGVEALEAVRLVEYRLVLMDCQLPNMDGYEATRRIRSLECSGALPGGRRRLPILALTASARPDAFALAMQAGMDAFLAKPVEPSALLAAIEKHALG